MNANYPAQTRDARPALLLLAAAVLLLAAWFAAGGLAHLELQDFNLRITTQDTSQAAPAFQALRPPEPPTGEWRPLVAEAIPASPSGAKFSEPALSPVLQPVATPPASR